MWEIYDFFLSSIDHDPFFFYFTWYVFWVHFLVSYPIPFFIQPHLYKIVPEPTQCIVSVLLCFVCLSFI